MRVEEWTPNYSFLQDLFKDMGIYYYAPGALMVGMVGWWERKVIVTAGDGGGREG